MSSSGLIVGAAVGVAAAALLERDGAAVGVCATEQLTQSTHIAIEKARIRATYFTRVQV